MPQYPKREGGLQAWREDVAKVCATPKKGRLIYIWGNVYRCQGAHWANGPKLIWVRQNSHEVNQLYYRHGHKLNLSFRQWRDSLNDKPQQTKLYKDE